MRQLVFGQLEADEQLEGCTLNGGANRGIGKRIERGVGIARLALARDLLANVGRQGGFGAVDVSAGRAARLGAFLAVGELLVFMGVVAPGFTWANFTAGGWAGSDTFSPQAIPGILAATPFAIWFFLAIEGVAMAAEEARDPHRTIPRAYIGGMLTLVALALGVMFFAGGVGDWSELANINDPLPQAMKKVVGDASGWLHMLVWLGLFGLVASFHGIIMGYSRQIFAMARAGYLPRRLATLHPTRGTPWVAILTGGVVGIAAIFSDSVIVLGGQPLTANIVTMAVLGAMVMYISAMASLFVLRRREPDLPRSFPAIGYPWVPGLALVLAIFCLGTVIWSNPGVSLVFGGLMTAAVAGHMLYGVER